MADNILVTTGSVANGANVLADELTDGVMGTGKVQFIKIMDGTLDSSTKATVKGGSTGPIATDTQIVVGIHPSGSAVQTRSSFNVVSNAFSLNAAISMTLTGQDFVYAVVSNIPVGTIVPEISTDNSSWSTATYGDSTDSGAAGIQAGQQLRILTAGYNYVRIRISAYTSGNLRASFIAAPATLSTIITGLPAGANQIGSVSLAVNSSIKITDGTNIPAVKAASTAPVATDPALVVTMSPNSPVPTGTNTIGSVKLTDGTNVGIVKAASTTPVATDPALVVSLSPNSAIIAVNVVDPTLTYRGKASSFRTPGRAGTSGQKILAIHNATGSSTVIRITKVAVDLVQTVVKAVTVLPPIIRMWRVTGLPTNGTALTKVSRDSILTSNTSVTVFGDASADGTSSGTALTATLPAGMIYAQEYAPRLLTAAGYEMFDHTEFLNDGDIIVLRALEGVVLFLDYTLATQNPLTDMWVCGVYWYEATS